MPSQPRRKGHQSGTTFFKHDHNSRCLTRCTDIQIQIYLSVASLFVTHNTHHSYGWKGPGKECWKMKPNEYWRQTLQGQISQCLVRSTQSWTQSLWKAKFPVFSTILWEAHKAEHTKLNCGRQNSQCSALSCERHPKLNTQSWIVEGRIPSVQRCLVRGTQSWTHKAEVFWAIIPEGGNLKRSWLLMSWNKIPFPPERGDHQRHAK